MTSYVARRLFALTASLFAINLCALAQGGAKSADVPVSMIVSVDIPRGARVPNISAQNVSVYQGGAPLRVTDWVQDGALELFLLLEDSPQTSYGRQLADLRQFIMAQPSTTKVGVAYLQAGGPRIVQGLTSDHAAAATALRPSMSTLARSASPYDGLAKLIERWPAGNARREILMISGGADETFRTDFRERGLSDATPARDVTPAVIEQTWTRPSGTSPAFKDDPYVDSAIDKAQRAGIVVSAICTPGHDIGSDDLAQSRIYLSQVAQETGGEFYCYQSATPVSFVPYLNDSTRRLTQQYLVTFLARAGKLGTLRAVKVRTDVPHTELTSAKRVYVPAAN
jgi:hypothetical protein